MSFLVFIVIVVGLWQGGYWLFAEYLGLVHTYAMPSPSGVMARFFVLMGNGSLLKAVGYSLLRGMAGFALAVIFGVAAGLLCSRFRGFRRNLRPVFLGAQALPSICWAPFSILWFGLSTRAIIFVVVMGSMFGIAIAVDNAIRNVQPIYKKVALTMGAARGQMYRYIIFPAALPELAAGLKQGWSFAWRALMSGEVMTTSIGLGQTLITGRDLADIDQVMLAMLLIVLIGIVIDRLIFAVMEERIMKKRGLG